MNLYEKNIANPTSMSERKRDRKPEHSIQKKLVEISNYVIFDSKVMQNPLRLSIVALEKKKNCARRAANSNNLLKATSKIKFLSRIITMISTSITESIARK